MLFSDSVIKGNLISGNGKGEFQGYSSGIQVSSAVNNQTIYCVNNTLSGNTIENHRVGLWAVRYSRENVLFHNNFINNTRQISASTSTWKNNVTENYWSDYDGTDADNDGLGDVPYTIDKVQDNRPLMGIFSSLITSQGHYVKIISNSTINNFRYFEDNNTIRMYVSNTAENQTTGFCRMIIPHEVLSPPYSIMINNRSVTYTLLFENRTSDTIYFNYAHSMLKILIVPEYPKTLIVKLLSISTLLTIVIRRRRKIPACKN